MSPRRPADNNLETPSECMACMGMGNREMNEYEFKERRSGKDRRARPTSPFTVRSLAGSRRLYRRKEDVRKYFFVDLYSPFSAAVLVFTLILSIADAFLTLKLIGQDVHELNPVMDFFLRMGTFQFIMAKWFFTACGLLTLIVFKNYYLWQGKVRTAVVLALFPCLYLVLVSYEIYLAVRI